MAAGCRIQAQLVWACLLVAPLVGGCAHSSKWYAQDQLNQGYTIVLPGILGRGPWDHSLARNLNQEADTAAIEIYDWTNGPVLFLHNALALKRKHAYADQIAQRIVEYQARYPGRPVHLVGHSGGASLATMVLEALPPGSRIESATLLGCGLPRDYDLTPALAHTKSGIHNYYSYLDVPISMVFSGLLTVARGQPQRVAGAFGFEPCEVYETPDAPQLVQHRYGFDMLQAGHWGGHFGWTVGPFVRKELAPLLAQTPTTSSATSSIQPVTFIVTDQNDGLARRPTTRLTAP